MAPRARIAACVPAVRAERRHHAVGHVLGPDRLIERPARARHRDGGKVGEPLEQREPRVAGRVDDRRTEHGPCRARGLDRLAGERLGAEEARARVVGRAHRREEDEPARAGPLGGAHEPQRGDRVQLLDRGAGLVADRRCQVDHGVDPAERVAKRRRVRQVAQRDLHAHALVTEAARVAHEAAHGSRLRGEPPQQRPADGARGSGEQDHAVPAVMLSRGGHAAEPTRRVRRSRRPPARARRERAPVGCPRRRHEPCCGPRAWPRAAPSRRRGRGARSITSWPEPVATPADRVSSRSPGRALLDRPPHPLGDLDRVGDRQPGQQHDELLAPDPVHQLEAAERLAHLVGHVAQHRVAPLVAVRVVHLLEVVEVEHHERYGSLR